ncbi:MAG: type II toxin-antitoxin system HicA family toxin [Pyramidobacter sp.]|nr:type II toxin-antitoxin system HicA family toxin [Pyramidobacter sp.]
MKRQIIIKRLQAMGFTFDHHGSRHDIYRRGKETRQVPRHNDINEITAKEILKDK